MHPADTLQHKDRPKCPVKTCSGHAQIHFNYRHKWRQPYQCRVTCDTCGIGTDKVIFIGSQVDVINLQLTRFTQLRKTPWSFENQTDDGCSIDELSATDT